MRIAILPTVLLQGYAFRPWKMLAGNFWTCAEKIFLRAEWRAFAPWRIWLKAKIVGTATSRRMLTVEATDTILREPRKDQARHSMPRWLNSIFDDHFVAYYPGQPLVDCQGLYAGQRFCSNPAKMLVRAQQCQFWSSVSGKRAYAARPTRTSYIRHQTWTMISLILQRIHKFHADFALSSSIARLWKSPDSQD